MYDTLLDECPKCGSTDLKLGNEENEDFRDDTDTACMNCENVFDARGRLTGGFNNDVAKELHTAFMKDIKNQLDIND